MIGGIVGGLALPILQEYLRVIEDWQLVAYGLAIMVVVLFIPGGVIELTRRIETSGRIRWPWSAKPVKKENPQLEGPHVSGT